MLWLITDLIAISCKSIKKGIAVAILFLGGLASSLSISFSPTVYASGARIFFAGDFIIVLVIGILLANLLAKDKNYQTSNANKRKLLEK